MKNAFVIAVAMFAFVACKNAGGENGDGTQTNAAAGAKVETVYDIAYIQMDSLLADYNRAIDLSGAFEAKATKIQNDLEARARSLQNEVNAFSEKMNKGLITTQRRQAELAEEQQVMMNQIFHAINDYVAKFNADYRYKMIVTSSASNPIIHADPALDITAEIVKGLNAEYAAEKKN